MSFARRCLWFCIESVTALQRVLDERLDALLADAPRRSVLMIDSGKDAIDGGYERVFVPSP